MYGACVQTLHAEPVVAVYGLDFCVFQALIVKDLDAQVIKGTAVPQVFLCVRIKDHGVGARAGGIRFEGQILGCYGQPFVGGCESGWGEQACQPKTQ